MKIVIDIDDKVYEDSEKLVEYGFGSLPYVEAIANGTTLPKGHGRLKDIDKVERLLDLEKPDNAISKALKNIIESVPTVIDADKETEDI